MQMLRLARRVSLLVAVYSSPQQRRRGSSLLRVSTGTARGRTPWHAVQRAAWHVLYKSEQS